MGPQALGYPTVCADRPGRSQFHPSQYIDSFKLPSILSASHPSDSRLDKSGTQEDPGLGLYMPPSTYLPSGSQDANYSFLQGAPHFPTPAFISEPKFNSEDMDLGSLSGDDDAEFDSNVQLRSQQLNSDGTPRRPMNAFMIFARKRRPMVSSEQPTMRTGEISKILSKEWSEMPKEDKQFYLDQAKKLKDTFNTRWPDYVYRRRPNNSRKRRKQSNASGVGPVRGHDGANSDTQVEATGDHSTSSPSGDESRSQSTDPFPSPLSTQHGVLFHTPELGHARKLDRSPTPASALTAYSGSIPSPYLPPIYTDVSSVNGFASRGHPYGGNIGLYYGNSDVDRAPELEPKMKAWHPYGSLPSGVVGSDHPSSSPVSMPFAIPQPHCQPISYPHAPSNWSKAEPSNDVHPYEGQSALWGVSPLVAGHRGAAGSQETSPLPSGSGSRQGFLPSTSSDANALGMHPYGNIEKSSFEGSHYEQAYMEPNSLDRASGSHHALTPSFQDGLSVQHDDSASVYFGPTH